MRESAHPLLTILQASLLIPLSNVYMRNSPPFPPEPEGLPVEAFLSLQTLVDILIKEREQKASFGRKLVYASSKKEKSI